MPKAFYLRSLVVPIPYGAGPVVVRNEKTVEFQLERHYELGGQNSRVKRKVIGKIDPANPEMMFPNESYFELIPDNSVPYEIREAFLSECQRRREIEEIKKNPDQLAKSIAEGLEKLRTGNFETEGNGGTDTEDGKRRYALARSVFDQMYCSMMDLAEKRPNEVVDKEKVRMINDVLEVLRENLKGEELEEYLEAIQEPEPDECDENTLKGLTYSDVFMLMQWYKVLQRGW